MTRSTNSTIFKSYSQADGLLTRITSHIYASAPHTSLINLSKKESQMLLLPKLTFHYGRSKSEKIKQKKQVHLKISKSFMNEQIEKRSISNNSSVQNLNNLSSPMTPFISSAHNKSNIRIEITSPSSPQFNENKAFKSNLNDIEMNHKIGKKLLDTDDEFIVSIKILIII